MDYSFNTEVAKEVGLNAAVIYNNIKFWCLKNRANNKHFHDGFYWTYNSVKAMEVMFDFLSPGQIRTALKKLEDNGYIASGNFNKAQYDRTKWYCDLDKLHLSFLANGVVTNGKPIPDINTDNKPYTNSVPESTPNTLSNHVKKERIDYGKIMEIYNSHMTHKPINKIHDKRKQLIRKFFDDTKIDMETFEGFVHCIANSPNWEWTRIERTGKNGVNYRVKTFDWYMTEDNFIKAWEE